MNVNTAQKDLDALILRGWTGLETKPEHMQGYITPNKQFFVCSDGSSPAVDTASYRLRIGGAGVSQPLELSYDALLKLPSHTLIACLECAGSQRQLFKEIMDCDMPPSNGFDLTPWMLGAVGNAVWTGVQLRTLLELAGVSADAVDVNALGLDVEASEGGVNRPIPIAKALDPDTLVAYFMNGEPLPAAHGFPLRLIVPGWIGSNSIKWLGSIDVSTDTVWTYRNVEHYVYIGDEWPAGEHEPAFGGAITEQNIKSSLSLAWKAELPAGRQLLRGVARSPQGAIARVEWSADNGATWRLATLIPPNLKYAWTRFEFEWDASAGKHTIMTRATDDAGNVQPMTQPFNREGYLFNRVYPHPVIVGGGTE